MARQTKSGSLVCVGIGMTLGSHLTPLAKNHIVDADVVFTALSNGLVELWLAKFNADVRSLQSHYAEGRSRLDSYRGMVESVLVEVRAGKNVCAAFYGHPGVFAWPAHRAIEQARAEGFEAHMEPGISAEDCLYADIGIDPGKCGCQHYEASQLLFYRRHLDTSAYLVLWQAGVVGDATLSRFATGPEYRQALVDVLARDYPVKHEVILYEAALLPVNVPRIERLPLADLVTADISMHATLVIPPARALQPDLVMRKRLAMLEAAVA